LAIGCDGLGSTGSLSHFIYMFIHLYVWFFVCAKNKFFFFFFFFFLTKSIALTYATDSTFD